jgi:hypothetical protein
MKSTVSYPDRGAYGKSNYRGNCSGHIIKDLFKFLMPKSVSDPSEGGGTCRDVCKELNISYFGFDLSDGFNILKNSLLEKIGQPVDTVWYHPAYHNIVKYSGNVWGTKPHPDDLSNCSSYEEFMEKLQSSLYNIYDAINKDGHYAVLIGDIRKNGEFYSPQSTVASMAPGNLQSVVIKHQYNCMSERVQYSGKFIPILHEYMLLFKKPGTMLSFVDCGIGIQNSLVAMSSATWKAIVGWALRKLGGEATLDQIYRVVSDNAAERVKNNPNWQAKVRQVLQQTSVNVDRGQWALKAA